MKTWIYSWVVYPILYSLAWVIGLFNPKIRQTLRLRSWKNFLSLRFNASAPIEYWIHVASTGELEYAIPIIEELQKRKKQVLVTYYSISARDRIETLPTQYSNVSLVVPLPHDGLGLMKEFVRLVRSQGVNVLLIMKYELWPGLLWECRANNIAILLVDALKPSWFHMKLIHKLDGIIAGYPGEVVGLQHPHIKVLGDTRVDRVQQRILKASNILDKHLDSALILKLQSHKTIVFGSMWPADNELLIANLELFKQRKVNLVWVPHELNSATAAKMQKACMQAGLKVLVLNDALDSRPAIEVEKDNPIVVLIMKKGILAELYRLGCGAYVGGGMLEGVHSVWEPALLGIPIACGPKRQRSPESYQLQEAGILAEIHDTSGLFHWIENCIQKQGNETKLLNNIMLQHQGAAGRIIDFTEEYYGHKKHPLSHTPSYEQS